MVAPVGPSYLVSESHGCSMQMQSVGLFPRGLTNLD